MEWSRRERVEWEGSEKRDTLSLNPESASKFSESLVS